MNKLSLFLILPLLALGCNKSPYDRTTGGVLTGTGTGPSAGSLVIFYNELSSGGGAFEFPGGANQTLSFSDTSQPTISNHSIRYFWNGQPPLLGDPGATFAGFDLMHTPTLTAYDITPGVNLTSRGFTKVTFYARGSLSSNTVLKVEVADDGVLATPDPCLTLSSGGSASDDLCAPGPLSVPVQTLTSSWQHYSIAVPNSVLTNVKDYFKATYVFSGGGTGGGTVYFDRIVYEP